MNTAVKKSNKDKDLILVRRAKRGDYKAFDLLVLKYQSRIIGLAMKFVKDIQTAEDVAQESFRADFENSPTMQELLVTIPVFLIKDLNLGLRGGLVLALRS